METEGVERYTHGMVNVTDMTYIYPSMDRKNEPGLTSQVFQAHLYGDSKPPPPCILSHSLYDGLA